MASGPALRHHPVDLLHIAAHSVFLSDQPRSSHVALADGSLKMDEVFADLDLTGVNLVVLSACETGLGRRTEGDEVLGLVRAFLYAGSSSVLATLWKVDDAASAH